MVYVALYADTPAAREAARALLESHGYEVRLFKDSRTAGTAPSAIFAFFISSNSSLPAVRDWISKIKDQDPHASIFVNCPSATDRHVAELLNLGADECLPRPLNPQLLAAYFRVLVRRRVLSGDMLEPEATQFVHGPIRMNLIHRTASLDGVPVVLTRVEFDLLRYFLQRAGRPLSRDQLLRDVWGYPETVRTRTLDKHVQFLRKKLGRYAPFLQTRLKHGYLFRQILSQTSVSK